MNQNKYTKGQRVFVKYTQEQADAEFGTPYVGVGYFVSEDNGGWEDSCTIRTPCDLPWEFEEGIFPYDCISADPSLT